MRRQACLPCWRLHKTVTGSKESQTHAENKLFVGIFERFLGINRDKTRLRPSRGTLPRHDSRVFRPKNAHRMRLRPPDIARNFPSRNRAGATFLAARSLDFNTRRTAMATFIPG